MGPSISWPGSRQRSAKLLLFQHNTMFGLLIAVAHRLAPKSWLSGFASRAEAIDDAIVATIVAASPCRTPACYGLSDGQPAPARFGSTTRVLGKPLSVIDSLDPGKPQRWRPRRGVHDTWSALDPRRRFWCCSARCSGCREPGLSGFSHQTGSELALGLPGLAAWQWAEGCRWLAGREGKVSAAMTIYRGVAVAGELGDGRQTKGLTQLPPAGLIPIRPQEAVEVDRGVLSLLPLGEVSRGRQPARRDGPRPAENDPLPSPNRPDRARCQPPRRPNCVGSRDRNRGSSRMCRRERPRRTWSGRNRLILAAAVPPARRRRTGPRARRSY